MKAVIVYCKILLKNRTFLGYRRKWGQPFLTPVTCVRLGQAGGAGFFLVIINYDLIMEVS